MTRAYRTAGTLEPDADCLLDVLAAAQAARLSGERFCFGCAATLPALTTDHAATAIAELRAADLGRLRDHHMDLLRGTGRNPTLAERAAELIRRDDAVEQISAWREPRAEMKVSLRLETYHVSDVPAAYRWQGSTPIPRYSHPGRNILALLTVTLLYGPSFLHLDASDAPDSWKFTRERRWFAPWVPMSFAAWRAVQEGGGQVDPADGTWYAAPIKNNARMLALGAPHEVEWR